MPNHISSPCDTRLSAQRRRRSGATGCKVFRRATGHWWLGVHWPTFRHGVLGPNKPRLSISFRRSRATCCQGLPCRRIRDFKPEKRTPQRLARTLSLGLEGVILTMPVGRLAA